MDTARVLLRDLAQALGQRSLLLISHDALPEGVVHARYRLQEGRLQVEPWRSPERRRRDACAEAPCVGTEVPPTRGGCDAPCCRKPFVGATSVATSGVRNLWKRAVRPTKTDVVRNPCEPTEGLDVDIARALLCDLAQALGQRSLLLISHDALP
ncbi:hypothetical protein QE400_003020 [Xanthomonas sacchari]|nr:hypothetical protein [Xanthomonas sacchari]